MLQVISGKFYKKPERYSTPARGITFSNYHMVAPITTCVATLEPVDAYVSATGAYIINYTNVIEKPKKLEGMAVVRGGDSAIVRQFELLCIFGLQAFFDGDRNAVEMNCRAKPSQATDQYVPAHYTERFFDSAIMASPEDADRLTKFVAKVVGLPRKQYEAVINALEAFAHSLEIINYQLDLAYSMLVYSLESLCQTFDAYSPSWEHYDGNVREALNPLFAGIDDASAESIRGVLLKAGHFQLQRRFISFVTSHIGASFYLGEAAARTRPVKKSEIEHCLLNAYKLRSGYVHQLRPILSQLRIPQIAKSDVFVWDNEPYFTYSGLLRTVHCAIWSFVESEPVVVSEDFNWRRALPGVVELQAAPELWVWVPTSFTPGQARLRLSGSLSLLQRKFTNDEPVRLNPLPLMEKIQSCLDQGKETDRIAMLAMYSIVLHQFVPKEHWPKEYTQIASKYQGFYRRCCIEMMLVWMITEDTWPWSPDESAAVLEEYRRKKFKKSSITIPTLIEICLCAVVANRFLEDENLEAYEKWCDAALFEAPGIPILQEYISSMRAGKGRLDPQQLITLRKDVSSADDTAEEIPPLEIKSDGLEEPSAVETSSTAVALVTGGQNPGSAAVEGTGIAVAPPTEQEVVDQSTVLGAESLPDSSEAKPADEKPPLPETEQ